MSVSKSVERRFWSKVKFSKRGCWIWTGALLSTGYGKFQLPHGPGEKQKAVRAHRYSFFLAYGAIDEQLSVLHSCDTPSCVRPTHLRQGSDADNAADKVLRNRQYRPRRRKLTVSQVREIRNGECQGYGLATELAKKYGVTWVTIYEIWRGDTWKGV